MKTKLFWWFIGLLNGLLLALDISWARHIDPSKAGVSLWIFLAVAAGIVLLQAVPAIILFTAFMFQFRGRSSAEEAKEIQASRSVCSRADK
jgi:ethanolamine ammonia-lyase large subunit